jgi:hypothetical protein
MALSISLEIFFKILTMRMEIVYEWKSNFHIYQLQFSYYMEIVWTYAIVMQ